MGFDELQPLPVIPWKLPSVNFLDGLDADYVDAIIDKALPEDRSRFRTYLSERPLGIGSISSVSMLDTSASKTH